MTRAEFDFQIICWWVEHDPERFIARLERNLRRAVDETGEDHQLWTGAKTTTAHRLYGTMSFRWNGRRVQILTHRLFLMLMLRHPIPLGFHASHDHAICPYANCVKHIFLESEGDNTAEGNRRRWQK